MAKLEERVTPLELLDEIREGALKAELVRKYRTSDQELAMALHDLYRRGAMTKEEFNDFFRGIAIKHSESPAEPPSKGFSLKPEYDSPSQILKSITEAGDHQPRAEERIDEESAVRPAPPAVLTVELVREAPQETQAGLKPDHTEAIGSPQVSPPAPVALEEPAGAVTPVVLDPEIASAGLAAVLQTISAKIHSIDSRLSNIEKKLGLS